MNQQMGLIGRKLGMTQIFDKEGDVVPCTVIEAGPNTILAVKTSDSKDGYIALQLGFGEHRKSRINKALAGQAKQSGVKRPARYVRELRVKDATGFEVGKVLNVSDVFKEGGWVDVRGVSKGRGFSGVMRRHNFKGFERSHGVHEYFRHGGSIGTRLTPGMTLAGKKMPGHMGAHFVTVQNLEVAKLDAERGLVYIRGGVPGPNGGLVSVRIAVKGGKKGGKGLAATPPKKKK